MERHVRSYRRTNHGRAVSVRQHTRHQEAAKNGMHPAGCMCVHHRAITLHRRAAKKGPAPISKPSVTLTGGKLAPQTFYDMKAKKKFVATSYRNEKRGKMNFIVATTPSGKEAWKILPKTKEETK